MRQTLVDLAASKQICVWLRVTQGKAHQLRAILARRCGAGLNELRLVTVLGNCLQLRVTNGLVLELKPLLLEGFKHFLGSMIIVNVS